MADAPPPPRSGRLAVVALLLAMTLIVAGLYFWGRPNPAPAPVDPGLQGRAAPDEQRLAHYLARADARRGQTIFDGRCGACHTVVAGGPHSIGPNLYGVLGGGIAQRPGYAYSRALSDPPTPSRERWRWDWETLNQFLTSPRSFAPGTRMTFAGMLKPQDRADVMLYLDTEAGGTLTPPAAR